LTLAVALSGGPWLGGFGLTLERGLRARLGRPRGQRRDPQHLGCVVRVETLGGLDPEQPRQHRSQWACVGGFLRLVQLLLTQNLVVALAVVWRVPLHGVVESCTQRPQDRKST